MVVVVVVMVVVVVVVVVAVGVVSWGLLLIHSCSTPLAISRW